MGEKEELDIELAFETVIYSIIKLGPDTKVKCSEALIASSINRITPTA